MRSRISRLVAIGVVVAAATTSAQNQPAPAAAGTDVYHIHITKAVPGQAVALGKAIIVPDKSAPMSTGTAAGGWGDIRQHSAFHRDTVADRIFPAK